MAQIQKLDLWGCQMRITDEIGWLLGRVRLFSAFEIGGFIGRNEPAWLSPTFAPANGSIWHWIGIVGFNLSHIDDLIGFEFAVGGFDDGIFLILVVDELSESVAFCGSIEIGPGNDLSIFFDIPRFKFNIFWRENVGRDGEDSPRRD